MFNKLIDLVLDIQELPSKLNAHLNEFATESLAKIKADDLKAQQELSKWQASMTNRPLANQPHLTRKR